VTGSGELPSVGSSVICFAENVLANADMLNPFYTLIFVIDSQAMTRIIYRIS
jgi:hypothetical protein